MKRTILLISIPFIIFTYIAFALSQKGCDYAMSLQAKSLEPFNHKTHMEKYNTDCESCHVYDQNGRFQGIPTVSYCLKCHTADSPSQNADHSVPLKKASLLKYKPTDKPWESHAKQPDLVYFSHKVVMDAKYADGRKKARCASCHGDRGGSTTTAKITGKMPMGQCMDCHTSLNISNACAVCHD